MFARTSRAGGRLQDEHVAGVAGGRGAGKGQGSQPSLRPVAREVGVVPGSGLARLSARYGDAAAIPISDVPNRAKALRQSGFLQVDRVLVALAGQPRAVE